MLQFIRLTWYPRADRPGLEPYRISQNPALARCGIGQSGSATLGYAIEILLYVLYLNKMMIIAACRLYIPGMED